MCIYKLYPCQNVTVVIEFKVFEKVVFVEMAGFLPHPTLILVRHPVHDSFLNLILDYIRLRPAHWYRAFSIPKQEEIENALT